MRDYSRNISESVSLSFIVFLSLSKTHPKVTIFSAIRNPGSLYFRNVSYDWTAPQNGDRWQDEAKTLFDPCPAGWRVPRSGTGLLSPWQALSTANSTWHDPAGTLQGRTWSDPTAIFGGSSVWYPGRGIRRVETANIGYIDVGYYWTSTIISTTPFRFRFESQTVTPENTTCAGICEGTMVRCVRE
ncbi:MAG: hypothetical protein K2G93_03280 [Rikenella sp.]|nr:hypothetical protein [Rikenella sp.]